MYENLDTPDACRVSILLAMLNGARDLPAQLESLADQSHTGWDLIVSDDGSADESPQIVRDFADRMAPNGHNVDMVVGSQAGSAANFLSLITTVPDAAGFVAFCDQDDVWLPDRLARGIAALANLPPSSPALYCSRTWITDAALGRRRLSALFDKPPSFRNALVQNIAAGNTILLNRAAIDLAQATAPVAAAVPGLAAHDWWIYQLITGAGGRVIYDPKPTLLYRQHTRNLVGANDNWRARMCRIGMLLGGRFADWNTANIMALEGAAEQLTADNRAVLKQFAMLRGKAFFSRLRAFAALRLYRQGRIGQFGLWLAVLLDRL